MRLQNPARCPECSEEIEAHPASRFDGKWEGYCPTHGVVVASQILTEGSIEERIAAPPEDKFCHILDAEDNPYCGFSGVRNGEVSCAPYNGEALCPTCGHPTCPSCAVMSSLNDRLEDM